MRVPAYRCAARCGDAQILERTTAEVPVARVFEEAIGSLDVLASESASGLIPETGQGEPNFVREEQVRFTAPGVERDIRALLVSDDPGELAALLREHCRPEGEGAVARLLRRIARHPERAAHELITALQREEYAAPQSYPWHGRQPRRRAHPDLATVSATYVARHVTALADDRDVRFYRDPRAVACAPVTVPHGAHGVRRLTFVLAIAGDSPAEPKAFLAFDGVRFRLLRSPAEIVGPLAAELDQRGQLYGRVPLDLGPQAHLVPRCLFRVPARATLEMTKSRAPRRTRPLARPGYVVDARIPLTLRGREPVVDDPGLVRAVLERTTHGIYLPGEPVGAGVPLHQLPEGESWLILADPGEAA